MPWRKQSVLLHWDIELSEENDKLKEEIKVLKCKKILNLAFGNYYELNPNTQQYENKIINTEKEI